MIKIKDLEDGAQFLFKPLKHKEQKDYPLVKIDTKFRGKKTSKDGKVLLAQYSEYLSQWFYYTPNDSSLEDDEIELIDKENYID